MNGLDFLGSAAIASLWMLGVTRIRSMLWGLSAQGLALGALLVFRGAARASFGEEALGVVAMAVKALAIPWFLSWSAVRLQVVRDRGAGIAPGVGMLLGTVLTVVCYFESSRFSAAGSISGSAGFAMAIVLIGLLIMVTRRLAIAMLVGFLVLDNGIFGYASTQTLGMPVAIELGVLFDLFAGVLLTGLVLFRVTKSFEHMDVLEMRELRE